MVYDQLNKPSEEKNPLPVDEDLPGMGQYYCLHCEFVSNFIILVYIFYIFFKKKFTNLMNLWRGVEKFVLLLE